MAAGGTAVVRRRDGRPARLAQSFALEELVSRSLAARVRPAAELIAHLRLVQQSTYAGQAEDHRQAVLRQEEALRELVREYTETYGERLLRDSGGETATPVRWIGHWRDDRLRSPPSGATPSNGVRCPTFHHLERLRATRIEPDTFRFWSETSIGRP